MASCCPVGGLLAGCPRRAALACAIRITSEAPGPSGLHIAEQGPGPREAPLVATRWNPTRPRWPVPGPKGCFLVEWRRSALDQPSIARRPASMILRRAFLITHREV